MRNIKTLIDAKRRGEDAGFTLIELLVVVIIIGILAAIAIPAFLNQQKSARDSAVTSDLRNVATNIETLRVSNPSTNAISSSQNGNELTITVGSDSEIVALSDGVQVTVQAHAGDVTPGSYSVYGYISGGSKYNAVDSQAHWDSTDGGLQEAVGAPDGVTP